MDRTGEIGKDGYNHSACGNGSRLHTMQVTVGLEPGVLLTDCKDVYQAVVNAAEIIRRRNNFKPASFEEAVVAELGPQIDAAEAKFEDFATKLDALSSVGDLEGAKALARSVGIDPEGEDQSASRAEARRAQQQEYSSPALPAFGPKKSTLPN